MSKYVIGVDVGGTNIKLGIVNRSGKIITRTNLVTKTYKRKEKLIDALIKQIAHFIKEKNIRKKDIKAIGIGLPGLIDPHKGVVNFLPNIPGWKNVPLKKIIEKKLKTPTFLDNDVNLITLAEWKFGAARGCKDFICMTLGTGVGAGLILNNQLYRGPGFVAGELGHMPINEKGPNCNCGGEACLESYVGNSHIIKKAKKIFKKKDITIPETRKFARKGDKRAFKLWEETAVHIGNCLAGTVNLLNPNLIVIGGGVSHSHMYMFPTIRKIIRQRALTVSSSMVKVVRAKLGSDAGIIGAAVLVNERF